ncbi:fungal pheromone STE3G-protein-coupled receptor [Athelia psychrophila]|uniref:Fungal pheromone STE3G-protein-coupled receptor n=1 Tax=Athelia psychrophila TaxID=1759441 RepID=A0A166QTS9_9AGAM|nr:fungal pheromone STE3G-protein-coupled receptor [Fibularhizoctonia sp. CBS 109695]
MMHPELPIGAFLAAILCLIPLPWHWRARNVSTISLIAWLFISNIIYGVDAIIWRDSAVILVPVWCDITTKLLVGATIALPACCLCICIQLERIASPRSSSMSATDKTRRRIFDAFMCWGLPIIYMALHCVVQGHRFDIIEVIGCRADFYVSVASICLQTLPPLLITALTFIYAGLALLHFFHRRMIFSTHLSNSSSGLTPSRYFRLMLMAVVEMAMGLAITTLDTWSNYQYGMRPWTSWADVHSNFGRIGQFPWILVPQSGRMWDLGMWWTIPLSSLIFFAFFGFGEEAVKEYGKCGAWIRRVVFRQGEKGSLGMCEIGSSKGSFNKSVPHSLLLSDYV